MSTHKLFAMSASHRWIACPGSMAFPENRESDGGSSEYADDGSMTHIWSAMFLKNGKNPTDAIGATGTLREGGKVYVLDEERAARIQGYVDDVRRRAVGGHLMVEISSELTPDVGGTADAAIALPAQRLGVVEDLKDGSGEKVMASYDGAPNPQLAGYALSLLPYFELFGPVDNVLLVVYQPKLNNIDEFLISVADLKVFGEKLYNAVKTAKSCITTNKDGLMPVEQLNPGYQQCRWCRAKTRCPAAAKFVEESMLANLETIAAEEPIVPIRSDKLSAAYGAVPFIRDWCNAVEMELSSRVAGGAEINGPDGKPYKFVEGKEGARKWTDPIAAAVALEGQLGPKAYSEPKVITAPQAAKLLKTKKTEALWNDVFEPLIKRPRGRPILTIGSDTRPTFTGATSLDDLEDIAE
jgi:hypothetical protein